uniref:Uncharacterized protein n=1 Tax=Romanomermis culicivorax TaxID=13658 RepID=A0A915IDY0_ROMCU
MSFHRDKQYKNNLPPNILPKIYGEKLRPSGESSKKCDFFQNIFSTQFDRIYADSIKHLRFLLQERGHFQKKSFDSQPPINVQLIGKAG